MRVTQHFIKTTIWSDEVRCDLKNSTSDVTFAEAQRKIIPEEIPFHFVT